MTHRYTARSHIDNFGVYDELNQRWVINVLARTEATSLAAEMNSSAKDRSAMIRITSEQLATIARTADSFEGCYEIVVMEHTINLRVRYELADGTFTIVTLNYDGKAI